MAKDRRTKAELIDAAEHWERMYTAKYDQADRLKAENAELVNTVNSLRGQKASLEGEASNLRKRIEEQEDAIRRGWNKLRMANTLNQHITRKYNAAVNEAQRHANIADNLRGQTEGLRDALIAFGTGLRG